MNITQLFKTKRILMKHSALMLAVLGIASGAQAANKTWLGNTDTNWNTSANWSSGPLASGDTPVFGVAGTRGLFLNNDTPAGTSYAGITFNNYASSFVIGGNSITLSGNIAGGNPSTEILNFDIALNTTPTISGANSVITLGGVISGTGYGLTRSAGTTLTLTNTNTFDGVVTLSAGTLVATTLVNGGNPSSIGQSSAAASNLMLGNGTTFKYTGPAVTTDRSFTINGAGITLDASGSGAINWSNTATPGYGAINSARTLTLFSSNPGDNTLAALLANNGSGAISVTKSGYGSWILSNANTYSGKTTLSLYGLPSNGNTHGQYNVLVANTLANGGSPSSIGQSSSTAANLLLGHATVLKYTGAGASTDRDFTIDSDNNPNQCATLDASGTGAINWTSTAAVAYRAAGANFTRTLYLSGTSTANNTLSALIGNNGTGATSLGKGGPGTWVLNGPVVNTYSGGTTITSGTLVEDFGSMTSGYANLINNGSALTLGGGTLSLKGHASNASSQSFSGNPTFVTGGVGSGLSIAGAGGNTMTLTLPNTWTRNVGSTVNVTLGANGTLSSTPTTANTLVVGNGNIAFATVGGTDWAKVSGGTVIGFVGGDYNTTLPPSGAINTVNYSLADSGTVTASETPNTLKINTTTTGQSLAIDSGQTLTLNAGGLLFVGADDYSITGGTLRGSGGTQKDLVVHHFGSGNLTIGSVIANNGGATALTKAGTGTLTLTNANTHTGATYAGGGGTLVLQNQLALQSSVLTLNNSSLVFDSSVSANAFTLGGLSSPLPFIGPGYDIALQNNAGTPAPITLTVGNGNGNGSYYGTLSGPGSLVKVGSGTQAMYGVNTYTGGTTISAGRLDCGFAQNDWFLGPNGNVQVTVQSGATLGLNRNNIVGTLNLNGGTVAAGNGWGQTWAGPVILGDGTTSTVNNTGAVTISGVISGSGALTKAGNSSLTLSAANTYSGNTTISAGTLVLTYSGSINNTPQLSIAANTTFDVSAISAYTLSTNTTLSASGAGTAANLKGASGGTVNLGSQPIKLTYTPTIFTGDPSRPALTVSQGALTLNNNPITVNNAAGTALDDGNYTLLAVTSGTINQNASPAYPVTVTGTGLASGKAAYVSVSGGTLVMTVYTPVLTSLVVTGFPDSQAAGVAGTVTVSAKDQNGNTIPSYAGTIHFTSTDGLAILPTDYTFVPGDNGTHTFVDGVTLKTAGERAITATDTVNGAVTGSQSGIAVIPLSAVELNVSGLPSAMGVGVAGNVTVEAKDVYGNNATNYTGTVHFTSSDGSATLPADYPFVALDAGAHTFTVGVVFNTEGIHSITAVDTVTGSIIGSQTNINVTSAATLASITVAGFPSPQTAGVAGSVTVTARDQNGDVFTAYSGTIHFTSTDTAAVLPSNYTFVPGDNGIHTFTTGVTLKTVGTHAVTATDSGNVIAGTQSGLVVVPSTATSFVVTGYPTTQFVGFTSNVTVKAYDAYNNLATNYTGTVSWTSSDTLAAFSPNPYTFTAEDAGQKVFSVTLNTLGPQSITATDTVTGTLTGTQSGITVYAVPSQFSWVNTVSGVWSVAGNWTNETGVVFAPVTGGQPDYTLNFNTVGTYTATHDRNNGFLLNKINFAGTVTLAGNSLSLTNNGATLPQIAQNSASAVVVNNNLALGADVTFGGTGNGQVDLATVISGPGSLTKNGSGLLKIYGLNPNTYSGGTVINSGTLHLGTMVEGVSPLCAYVLGTGPVTLNSGAMIEFDRASATNALLVNGGTIYSQNGWGASWNGPVTLNSNATVNTAWPMTFNGVVDGPGGFAKIGGSSMTFTTANTFAGTMDITAGSLVLGSAGSINGSTNIMITAGTTFDVSAKATYTLSTTNTLSANGAGTPSTLKGQIGGTVDLGSQPIKLTWGGALSVADTTHPALTVTQSSLTLNNNPIQVVNNAASPLEEGEYRLIQVGDGSTGVINGTPASTVVVTGTGGVVGNTRITASVSAGNVVMKVAKIKGMVITLH